MTVSEGALLVSVAFDKNGDDDQHFGVQAGVAEAGTSYSHLRNRGWIVKELQPPWIRGAAASGVAGAEWNLKGHTVTLMLDVERASVTFWAEGGQTATLEGLPTGEPLTAAVSLYNNTAVVTGLRHVRPPREQPAASPAVGAVD